VAEWEGLPATLVGSAVRPITPVAGNAVRTSAIVCEGRRAAEMRLRTSRRRSVFASSSAPTPCRSAPRV